MANHSPYGESTPCMTVTRCFSAILEDLFDDTLLNQVYGKLTEGKIQEGMDDIQIGLQTRRQNSSDQEWAEFVSMCLHHPIKDLLHQDPFTHRAFVKPRGYAGDAVLIDFIYGREEHWALPEGTTELGRQIFDYTTGAPAPEGVRARREYVANLLDRLVEERDRPHVLSIAAGHMREAILSSAVRRRKLGRLVALDSDTESLEEVDRCYSRYGVEVEPATIRQLLSQKTRLGDFDLVYSTGLFDYLQQTTAQRLTSVMFDLLRPKGRLLVANFLPGIRDIGYMESFMDWKLIYRTRHEMLEVSANIPQAEIRDIRIFTEENQNIIFLQIAKR
jgi:extracellular factor (EF) 3-hydroxypalmitic acid methyl ester biosynthesis protein